MKRTTIRLLKNRVLLEPAKWGQENGAVIIPESARSQQDELVWRVAGLPTDPRDLSLGDHVLIHSRHPVNHLLDNGQLIVPYDQILAKW